jgi:L-aminopeptidase/D-esterase-like protein
MKPMARSKMNTILEVGGFRAGSCLCLLADVRTGVEMYGGGR